MTFSSIQHRLAQVRREREVSISPALLLCSACAVFILALALNVLLNATPALEATEQAQQTTQPAS